MTANVVTVWTMPVGVPSSAALARWRAVLDATETAKAARFVFDEDRYTYIAAHALMRSLLSHVASPAPASWQFAAKEKGKPYIVGEPLQFNLSHTRGYVACAVTRDFAIGIDTESCGRKQKHADLAQTVMHPDEIDLLNAASEQERDALFLRFWTLREAHVKATGEGIVYPREDFSFSLDPPRIRLFSGDSTVWQHFSWDENGHIISLAINTGGKVTVERRLLTESELL